MSKSSPRRWRQPLPSTRFWRTDDPRQIVEIERDVLPDRQRRDQAEVLEHHADAVTAGAAIAAAAARGEITPSEASSMSSLVANISGYRRLAGADEERTLARLRALRSKLIDPTIALHHGRVVKRTGDGSIIEFRSVARRGIFQRNGGPGHGQAWSSPCGL
jgi:class 3 adenylate cyclase